MAEQTPMLNNSPSNYQCMTTDSRMNYPKALRQLADILGKQSEIRRMASLRQYKGNSSVFASRATLARDGFTYVEHEHRLKCCGCDVHINPDAPDSDAKIEHHRLNSQCPFVLSNAQLFSNGNTGK